MSVLANMLIEKGDLLKVLRVASGFDTQACAYVGVQLQERFQFHRSSFFGFIQTNDFKIHQSHIFASLANLRDLLNVSTDKMNVTVDAAGKLRLESNDEYPVRLQVHTVRSEASGFKSHYLGTPGMFHYEGDLFSEFDIRPFKNLTTPPLLEDGRLLVSTLSGTVIWNGGDRLKLLRVQPRESFLRFIAGESVPEISISNQGYWTAEKEGLVCAMSSHQTPKDLLKVYATAGTELTRFNAVRLLASLSNVAYLTADTEKVELHPKEGIVCRDKFNNPQVFPHTATSTSWPRAIIFGRTAKFIVDALSQSSEEVAVLYSVPLRHPTYRIVRGNFEVTFGLV